MLPNDLPVAAVVDLKDIRNVNTIHTTPFKDHDQMSVASNQSRISFKSGVSFTSLKTTESRQCTGRTTVGHQCKKLTLNLSGLCSCHETIEDKERAVLDLLQICTPIEEDIPAEEQAGLPDDVDTTTSIPSPETKSFKLLFFFLGIILAYLYLMIFSTPNHHAQIDYNTDNFKAPLLAIE